MLAAFVLGLTVTGNPVFAADASGNTRSGFLQWVGSFFGIKPPSANQRIININSEQTQGAPTITPTSTAVEEANYISPQIKFGVPMIKSLSPEDQVQLIKDINYSSPEQKDKLSQKWRLPENQTFQTLEDSYHQLYREGYFDEKTLVKASEDSRSLREKLPQILGGKTIDTKKREEVEASLEKRPSSDLPNWDLDKKQYRLNEQFWDENTQEWVPGTGDSAAAPKPNLENMYAAASPDDLGVGATATDATPGGTPESKTAPSDNTISRPLSPAEKTPADAVENSTDPRLWWQKNWGEDSIGINLNPWGISKNDAEQQLREQVAIERTERLLNQLTPEKQSEFFNDASNTRKQISGETIEEWNARIKANNEKWEGYGTEIPLKNTAEQEIIEQNQRERTEEYLDTQGYVRSPNDGQRRMVNEEGE